MYSIEGIETPTDYAWSSATVYASDKADRLIAPARHPYRENWRKTEKQCRLNYMGISSVNPVLLLNLYK